MKQQQPQDDNEVVTAYTAGADAAPPAYPGQPANVHPDRLLKYVPRKMNTWTKGAVIAALIGLLFPVGSLAAVIFGFGSLCTRDEAKNARFLAIVAIVMGVVELVFVAVLIDLYG
jgi:hypothetical protein